VSFDDWVLALHVLSAFAYIGGIVLFWVLVVAVRKIDTPDGTIRMEPIVKVGNAVIGVGAVGTIVLGIYLAFALDSYAIWDGWIIAAIVLWLVGGLTGSLAGKEYQKALTRAEELKSSGQQAQPGELRALNRSQMGLALLAVSSLATVLILIDMIWKPGH